MGIDKYNEECRSIVMRCEDLLSMGVAKGRAQEHDTGLVMGLSLKAQFRYRARGHMAQNLQLDRQDSSKVGNSHYKEPPSTFWSYNGPQTAAG